MKARKLEQKGKQEPLPIGPFSPPIFLCCLVIRTPKVRDKREGTPYTWLVSRPAGARKSNLRQEDTSQLITGTRRRYYEKTQANPGYTPRGEDPTFYRILINKRSYVYYTDPRSRRGIHLG